MRRKSERNKDKEKEKEKEKEKAKPAPEKPKRGRPAKRRKKSSSEEERDSAGEQGVAPVESPPLPDDQVWHVKASDSSADSGEIQKLKLCLARPAGEASPRGRKPLDRSSSRSDASETSEDKKRGRHRSRRSSAREHKEDDDDGPTTRSALKRSSPVPEEVEVVDRIDQPSSPEEAAVEESAPVAKQPEKVASEVATSSSQDVEDIPPGEIKCDTTESPETSPDSTVDVRPIIQEPEPVVVVSGKETECEAEPVIKIKNKKIVTKKNVIQEKVVIEEPKIAIPVKVEGCAVSKGKLNDKTDEFTNEAEIIKKKETKTIEKDEPEKANVEVVERVELKPKKEEIETVEKVEHEVIVQKIETQLPEKVEMQLPEKIETKVPEEKETQVPKKIETQVPKKIETQVPENIETKVPEKKGTQVSKKIETQVPKKVETQVPEEIETNVPKKIETKVPEKIEIKITEKIETIVLEKIETQLPEKIEAKLPEKIEAKLPEKIETKVLEKIETKVPKKIETIVSEKVVEEVIVEKEKVFETKVVQEEKKEIEPVVDKPVEKVKEKTEIIIEKPKSPKKEITESIKLHDLPKSTRTEVHTETATTTTAARKRKWGSRPKLSKSNSVNISTDSLKNIISNVEPVGADEVLFDVKSSNDSEPKPKKANVDLDNKKTNGKYSIPELAPERETVGSLAHRKISIVNEETSKLQRSPSPPKFKTSAILYITNLVRPFTLPLLKNLLQRTGRIVENGFWIDKIKSKCYVQYETEDEAIETRHALHGVTWPFSNPKTLNVDFGSREAMDEAMATTEEDKSGYADARSKDAQNKDRKIGGIDSDEKVLEKRTAVREWDLGKGEGREEYLDRPNNRQRDALDPERKKRRTKSRSPSPARKFKKKEEEAPSKLLDDLFKKTKTTPCIYWLPLDPEVILIKEEQRRKHMAEHERRFEELRKADEQRMSNRHTHHTNRHR